MSRWRDYDSEMPTQRELDDVTVEAVLRGHPVSAEFEPLAWAVAALRTPPEQPVPLSAELAARMATGDFPSAAASRPSRRSAGRKAGRHRAARRKLATLPLRAKVAAASALAIAGMTTATVAGALPEPAQHHFEMVIESVTPFEFVDRSEFGQEVADDARDGGVDGQDVSEKAREQGQGSNGSTQDRQPSAPESRTSPDRPAPESDESPAKSQPPVVKPVAPPDDVRPGQQDRPLRPGKPDSAEPSETFPVQTRDTG